jgi:type I restriction enzyme S subunit
MTRDFQYLPLRHVAAVKNSNVDKLSLPGESPVRLCNYVDVYRNDRITQAVSFMRASATPSEIASFKLCLGDVLITKDSEQWNDIGVPALVATEADDLVCGYHLTMLRPHPLKILGSYLAYALRVPEVAVQLHLAAKGVTRYGLSQQGIKSAQVPVPPLEEQGLIVRYLDHAELRIAKAISAKQEVVRLLREARLAMISETVLAGIGTDVERIESGIPGVGSVPSHWRIRRAKYVWKAVDVRSATGTEERLTVSSASGIVPRSSKNVTMFEAATYVGHKVAQPNDLVINSLWAWAGGLGVSNHDGLVSPVYGVYRLRDNAQCDPEFMHNLLRSNAAQWQFQVRSKGIWRSRLSITDEAFFDMPLPLPPIEEQRTIAAVIRTQTTNVDKAIASVLDEIALLKEYRTCLISDVVTGKLDVREEAAKLPEIDPMELATVSVGENGDDEEATDDD